MEMNLQVLSQQQVEGTVARKQMRLSGHASQMVFQLFTKSVYSNAIGTVVREITSNCFDSHVEAGVENTPVLIKKSYDAQTDTYYISFIDKGMGMSPDRVENIYGVYFESTKRDGNDQIGGFGIGGKTPLAYKRINGEGEADYDNSFFVITNYNGIKYYYNIFEGTESPEFALFHQEETTERNGTEVRIPMLKKDIPTFEKELKEQLLYFEGIVFEGFDNVTNDYKIIRGKTFLYRPDTFDNYIHVGLGRVYYPINYRILGLNKGNYNIPVGINVPIGKISVTVSREQLDYSEQTITYLKKAIEEVKNELKTMLSNQYDNIVSLEDYFNYKNNFGSLKLTNDHSIHVGGLINRNEVSLVNFKYNELKFIPDETTLFTLFFSTRMFGKKPPKRSWSSDGYGMFDKSFKSLISISQSSILNVYACEEGDFKIKRIKQSYLNSKHGRFYVVIPRNILDSNLLWKVCDEFKNDIISTEDFKNSRDFELITQLQEEYFEIVRKYAPDYAEVEVPKGFTASYSKNALPADIMKRSIPISWGDKNYKDKVKIKELVDFKGRIFYAEVNNKYNVDNACSLFKILFGNDHLVGYDHELPNRSNGKKNANVMFIAISQSNLKYMKYCSSAIPVNDFYTTLLKRKESLIKECFRLKDIENVRSDIGGFYFSKYFTELSPKWSKTIEYVNDLHKRFEKRETLYSLNLYKSSLEHYINLSDNQCTKEEQEIKDNLVELKTLEEINRDILSYIKIPTNSYCSIVDSDTDDKMIPEILKKLLKF